MIVRWARSILLTACARAVYSARPLQDSVFRSEALAEVNSSKSFADSEFHAASQVGDERRIWSRHCCCNPREGECSSANAGKQNYHRLVEPVSGGGNVTHCCRSLKGGCQWKSLGRTYTTLVGNLGGKFNLLYDSSSCDHSFETYDLLDRTIEKEKIWHSFAVLDVLTPSRRRPETYRISTDLGPIPLLKLDKDSRYTGNNVRLLYDGGTSSGKIVHTFDSQSLPNSELAIQSSLKMSDFIRQMLLKVTGSVAHESVDRDLDDPWDPAAYNCQHYIGQVLEVLAPNMSAVYRRAMMHDAVAITNSQTKTGKKLTQVVAFVGNKGGDLKNALTSLGEAAESWATGEKVQGYVPLQEWRKLVLPNGQHLSGDEVISRLQIHWADVTHFAQAIVSPYRAIGDSDKRFEAVATYYAEGLEAVSRSPPPMDKHCCCSIRYCDEVESVKSGVEKIPIQLVPGISDVICCRMVNKEENSAGDDSDPADSCRFGSFASPLEELMMLENLPQPWPYNPGTCKKVFFGSSSSSSRQSARTDRSGSSTSWRSRRRRRYRRRQVSRWSPLEPLLPGILPGMKRPKLILAQDINWPPYAYLSSEPGADTEVAGFGNDMAMAIGDECGIEIAVMQTDWRSCWENGTIGKDLMDGAFHACLAYVHTAERSRSAEFSKSILKKGKPLGLLSRLGEDGAPLISPTADLAGLKVVSPRDWAPTQEGLNGTLNTCTGQPFNGFTWVSPSEPGVDAALAMLLNGDADAMWVDADLAHHYQCNGHDDSIQAVIRWDCSLGNSMSWASFGTKFAYIHTGLSGNFVDGVSLTMAKKGSGISELVDPCLEKFMTSKSYYELCEQYKLSSVCQRNKYFPAAKQQSWELPTRSLTTTCREGYCPCPRDTRSA